MSFHSAPESKRSILPLVTILLDLVFFAFCMGGFLVATITEHSNYQTFWGVLLICDAIRSLKAKEQS